jgi:hypothetical protein
MRLALIAAAVLVAAGFGAAYAAGAFGGDSSSQVIEGAPPPPDGAELAAIRRLVLETASERGDPSPRGAVLVPTTSHLAELVDVDTVEPDVPVYFVLVDGEFDGGSLLAVTIEPRTDRLVNAGLVGAMPDLSAMGEPQLLRLYRR